MVFGHNTLISPENVPFCPVYSLVIRSFTEFSVYSITKSNQEKATSKNTKTKEEKEKKNAL